jgi:hypothetical protein
MKRMIIGTVLNLNRALKVSLQMRMVCRRALPLTLAACITMSGGVAARADSDVYNNITKKARGDAVLQVDTKFCTQRFGVQMKGTENSRTFAKFKQCMLGRGWRYAYTEREDTWIDPDITCKHGMFIGVPASVCSNY